MKMYIVHVVCTCKMVSVWFLFLVMVVIVVVFFPILLGVLLVYFGNPSLVQTILLYQLATTQKIV